MEGKEVRKRLQNNGFSLKSVADLLGETPQNFNSMLNAQDIKTGVVEKIAKAIKKPLYFFFPDKVELMSYEEMDAFDKAQAAVSVPPVPSVPVASHTPAPAEINVYKEIIAEQKEEITALNRTIGQLQERLNAKSAKKTKILPSLHKEEYTYADA